jgi:ribose transport system permease protein
LNVARQISVIAIIAFGQTLVILTAGIDLSVGSVLALSSSLMGMMMVRGGIPVVMAIIFAVVIGTTIGAANGFFIAVPRMPPFIVTLGMMGVARGLGLVVTGGFPIFGLPKSFSFVGNGYIGPVPTPVIIMLIVFAIIWFTLAKTKVGLYTYAIGGNMEACRLSGIDVNRYLILVYSVCGGCSGLAGVVLASRLNSALATVGAGYELDAIAAVVIGGTTLAGGEGGVGGTLIGALLMGIIRNGLNLQNVSPFWEQTIIGLVIIGAVLIDVLRKGGGSRKSVLKIQSKESKT